MMQGGVITLAASLWEGVGALLLLMRSMHAFSFPGLVVCMRMQTLVDGREGEREDVGLLGWLEICETHVRGVKGLLPIVSLVHSFSRSCTV